jgi:putative thioredoxin
MTNQNVIEVGEGDFQQQVVERSHEVPVVVDFWAPWCGPCRVLGPVIEQLAAEAEGEWLLAKVNTQDNPRVAQQFGIRGIPNVKAFVDGEVVEEFSGAQPRHMIETWLQRFLPSDEDRLLDQARDAEEAGSVAEAREMYESIVQSDPDNASARAALARLAVEEGDVEAAREQIDAVPDLLWGTTDGELEAGWVAVEAATARDLESLEDSVEADADDLDARFELAMVLADDERWEEALEHLLHIVATDREYRDDLGRVAMVRLFEVIGSDSDLANTWRGKMGAVMYV